MSPRPTRWTNPSVLAFAEDRDPVEAVTERARQIATDAMDQGWAGPPFDPLTLAELLRIDVVAREDVRDARTIPAEHGTPRIEYNPTRPRGRVRYSLAHEIAHALFPDWAAKVRNRSEQSELKGDEWQLEALCNIAAAEFVMPIGSFAKLAVTDLGIDVLLNEQKKYDVSMEALLIRLVHLRPEPYAMFCASPIATGSHTGRYRIDYSIGSRTWRVGSTLRGLVLPDRTIVAKCSAIGFTAKGREAWVGEEPVRVEAVGIPAYPGSSIPRVVGLLVPVSGDVALAQEMIEFVFGDASRPHGEDPKMIVQVVTDAALIWGGGGFAAAVRRTWPDAQKEFHEWVTVRPKNLSLGNVHFSSVSDGTRVASIVAQHGYGPSQRPRIRYSALRQGLVEVARVAKETDSSVHMPRLGTGLAGGSWDVVEELLLDTLGQEGVRTTVYDLPGRPSVRQESLLRVAERTLPGNP